MPVSTRGSQWQALRRSLALLQRLLQGPASAQELIDNVLDMEGLSAYPESASARTRAFKRDRENLRLHLGAQLEYNPTEKHYNLLNAGPYYSLILSERSLRALAIISQTFAGQSGHHSEIQDLLNELLGRLLDSTRSALDSADQPINLEIFQGVDANGIPEKVWQTVQRAVREHRKLVFNHRSPSRADSQVLRHEVLPVKIIYQGGHWYLRAWAQNLPRTPGVEFNPQGEYLRYRINYILNDETLAVSPQILARIPSPPRYLVHYRLLPPLSRGAISQHFDDMSVTSLPGGSVEIRGYTDDDFEAGRILLAYGELCQVYGSEALRERMLRATRGMAELYNLKDEF